MTIGESLLVIAIFACVGFGLYKIHQKKRWKLVAKIVSIIIAIIILISVGFYIYGGYKNRPQEVFSLEGISLGMKKVDVTIKKGKPDSEDVMEEGITTLLYNRESSAYSGLLGIFVGLDSNDEVYRICSFEYGDKIFDLGRNDQVEKVTEKLGEPQEKSINRDGTSMLITYPQFNVAFEIVEGRVNMTCVTTQERMSFIEEYIR